MAEAQIISLVENAGREMTIDEGLAFIERSRRQLDRFSTANPEMKGRRIVPEYEAEVRAGLDELEAELLMAKRRP